MSQLRAVAGLSINMHEANTLPLVETTAFVDRCRYYANIIGSMPQTDPETQTLLVHYMDIRFILELQVEAACNSLESLGWENQDNIPLIRQHVHDLSNLAVSLGSACVHKCATALAQGFLEPYTTRLVPGQPFGNLNQASKWFDEGKVFLAKFDQQYGKAKY